MTNTLKKKITYLFLFGLIAFSIFYLSNVLLPFFIGIFIAYLLDPCVDWLENRKINRGLGALIVLLIFLLIFIFVTFLILPILFSQIVSFINEFPNIIYKIEKIFLLIYEFLREKITFLPISDFLNKFIQSLSQVAPRFLNNIFSSSLAFINIIGLLFITPIVAWYFLKDWDKILQACLKIVSKKFKNLLLDYSRSIKLILDAYLRGQALVSLSLCIYYFLLFYFLDLNYSLFVGVFAGFFSFIPLIGIIISFLITSILAYLQFVDVIYIFYISLVFIGGQLLESNLLTPKLIGNKLGLHPLVVILAIFVFGAIFGIFGVIFSTPITAIILLLLKRNLINNG